VSFSAERDRELVSNAAKELGWPLEAPALEAILRFVELVDTENARTNLTGAREPKALVDVLLADAFVLAEPSCIPSGARVVDVGAGAGAPALPLALLRPDLDVTLVEPRRLRVAFMRTAIGELGLEQRARVEERKLGATPLPGAPFDVAFSRATFEPAAWLERGLPLAPRLVVLTGADPLPQKKKLARLIATRAYTLPGAGSARQLGVYARSGT
jgi:16S rRNA (guanine527-N7)-methyltransferase